MSWHLEKSKCPWKRTTGNSKTCTINGVENLCLNDQGGLAIVYSTSKNSHHTEAVENLANTLVASDYKDPPVVNDMEGKKYIVRRLTPKECGRLQGFPDGWCDCNNHGT